MTSISLISHLTWLASICAVLEETRKVLLPHFSLSSSYYFANKSLRKTCNTHSNEFFLQQSTVFGKFSTAATLFLPLAR
jgi:hypothetical protein